MPSPSFSPRRKREIVGITTVGGNAPVLDTTRNTLLVTQILQLDVAVHAGAQRPLLSPPRHAPQVHGESGLDGPLLPPLVRSPASADAIGFLLDASRREEGLWLLATGPLTNVRAGHARQTPASPAGWPASPYGRQRLRGQRHGSG